MIGNANLHEPDKLKYFTFVWVESVFYHGTFLYEVIFPVKCVIIFPQLQLAIMFTKAISYTSTGWHCLTITYIVPLALQTIYSGVRQIYNYKTSKNITFSS